MLANLQEFISPMGDVMPSAMHGSQTLVFKILAITNSNTYRAQVCLASEGMHIAHKLK